MNTSKAVKTSVIVVPRERPSPSLDSLRSVCDQTAAHFELVYVDCLLPKKMRQALECYVKERGGKYIRSDKFLYPNQSRNIGLRRASGDNLVFVENDVFVQPGWLEGLLACAKETGAGVVGPLYLEGDRHNQVVHCSGGRIKLMDSGNGSPMLVAEQDDLKTPLHQLGEQTRIKTGLIELHCVLITRKCMQAIGGKFDEEIRTTRDHVDLCMLAEKAGFDIYIEPASRVIYGLMEPIKLWDLPYFFFRWSDQGTRLTIAHFENKWKVRLDPGRRKMIRKRRYWALLEALKSGWRRGELR